ncbi:MAG: plasmid pRiA4b ORF-3 family protein [Oscillospiraceae bacterium]|nr:plasmid pRiA4b ORF-3 family protein [Oscillospiraceae bacterium]
MAAKVYTFHISYEGLEDTIWRKVEVSSNYRLDQLGYTVLAAFDTMAYHIFSFCLDDRYYKFPDENGFSDGIDMATVKLVNIDLKIGNRIRMDYDYGTTHTFWLELTGIDDMQQGHGTRYPYITEGAGQGIIDDMSCNELIELVKQIDKNGQTDEPIYYKKSTIPWDYRRFDLQSLNVLLKGEIKMIEEGYQP